MYKYYVRSKKLKTTGWKVSKSLGWNVNRKKCLKIAFVTWRIRHSLAKERWAKSDGRSINRSITRNWCHAAVLVIISKDGFDQKWEKLASCDGWMCSLPSTGAKTKRHIHSCAAVKGRKTWIFIFPHLTGAFHFKFKHADVRAFEF